MNRDEFIGKLNSIYVGETNAIDELINEYDNLYKSNMILENYIRLIYDLGFDYDGCETTENLMGLIDELTRLARLGIERNTKEVIFKNQKQSFNILMEKIKEGNNDKD